MGGWMDGAARQLAASWHAPTSLLSPTPQFNTPAACRCAQVKVRAAAKFLSKGHRVKLTLQFRGREMEFQQLGREMFAVSTVAACEGGMGVPLLARLSPQPSPTPPHHPTHPNPPCPVPHPPTHPPQRFVEDCGSEVAVEQAPQMQGRQMNMVLGPKKEQLQM